MKTHPDGYYSDSNTVYRLKNGRCIWIGFMENGELQDPDYYLSNYQNEEEEKNERERLHDLRKQLTSQLGNIFNECGEYLGPDYPTSLCRGTPGE